jgi:hypothetical protein
MNAHDYIDNEFERFVTKNNYETINQLQYNQLEKIPRPLKNNKWCQIDLLRYFDIYYISKINYGEASFIIFYDNDMHEIYRFDTAM